MKRILVLFAFVLTAGFVNAQDATTLTPQQERAHAMAMRLQKTVGLTPEQATQAEAIYLEQVTEVEAVQADAAKTQEQKDADAAAIRTAKEAKIMLILTPEQQTKYNDMKRQRQERRSAGTQE